MQRKQSIMMYRRIVDVCMTVLLLFLMAYQVTGEALHEWIGMGMTLIVIIHQILNRRWYAAIYKGRYNPYRILTTAVNVLLVISFLLTAICGMSMSGHAVPFLYGILKVSFSRKMHLSMSHWSFVLMGLHLGLHIPVITAKWKLDEKKKMLLSGVFCVIAGIGLYLFIKSGMTDPREHMTFPYRVQQIVVFSGATVRLLAIMTFSIMALLVPMALTGYAALSVDRQMTFRTPASIACAHSSFVRSVSYIFSPCRIPITRTS